MAPDQLELATVEVLGALAYGQLRSFQVTARAVVFAEDLRTADRLAELALREHAGYALLRDHLAGRTDLAWTVMERQKPHFDAYFDRVPVTDWFSACAFFSLGLPIAADFGRELAPTLDDGAGSAVLGGLADREPFEQFAVEHLRPQLTDGAAHDRARQLIAQMLGMALSGFQGIVGDTDALKVLLESATEDGESGEARVKRLAISVMGGHRRRMVELGLEDLEDVY